MPVRIAADRNEQRPEFAVAVELPVPVQSVSGIGNAHIQKLLRAVSCDAEAPCKASADPTGNSVAKVDRDAPASASPPLRCRSRIRWIQFGEVRAEPLLNGGHGC